MSPGEELRHAADADLACWLRLEQTEGVGPQTALALLQAFGLPENIFSASLSQLRQIIPDRVASRLIEPPAEALLELTRRTLQWAAEPGNRVLTLADPAYPRALLEIHDPPLLLYAKGRLDLLSRPMVAVVGSRNATVQGVTNAEKFSEALSGTGLTIISGMALGIDTAAHHGALRHANDGGSTVAVIGTGADIVYPARNRALAHQIAQDGCIISEYALGTPAIASNFPRRNRIISGLARGVLVVEAAAQSGSLITARMAVDQGRDVFAIPGSIHSPLAKGCHQLIKQGAKLVESAQDILEELRIDADASSAAAAPDAFNGGASRESKLLSVIGFDPIHLDNLIHRSECDVAQVQSELLILELDGVIERLPGEFYRRLG